MTDSSKLPVGEWRPLSEHPPQIPWAPVLTRSTLVSMDDPLAERGISVRKACSIPADTLNLLWRPTGIYREEYFHVTGQWI